jgi:hypothetical protein
MSNIKVDVLELFGHWAISFGCGPLSRLTLNFQPSTINNLWAAPLYPANTQHSIPSHAEIDEGGQPNNQLPCITNTCTGLG